MPTPRLLGPQQKMVVPSLCSYRQSSFLVVRSYAIAVLYGVVTYMMPLETIGVFSNDPSLAIPVWKIIRGTSCDTLAVEIVLSREYRWYQSLPPYVVQSPLWAAA